MSKKYRVVNFSHPLIDESIQKLGELTGRDIEVSTIKVHVDTEKPLLGQVKGIASQARREMPDLDAMVPPGLSTVAVLLYDLLGSPDVVIVNKKPGSLPPKYVVSEVVL